MLKTAEPAQTTDEHRELPTGCWLVLLELALAIGAIGAYVHWSWWAGGEHLTGIVTAVGDDGADGVPEVIVREPMTEVEVSADVREDSSGDYPTVGSSVTVIRSTTDPSNAKSLQSLDEIRSVWIILLCLMVLWPVAWWVARHDGPWRPPGSTRSPGQASFLPPPPGGEVTSAG